MAGSALDVSKAIAIKNPQQRQTAYNQAVSAYYPSPTPTVNQPVQQQQQPVQQSGGGGGGMFDEAAYQRQQEEALNNVYAPAEQYLNEVEQKYQQDYPGEQAGIEQQYSSATVPITEQQKIAEQSAALEKQKGSTAEKSAMGRARDMYNQLKQGFLTRFGGSSSIGEASQEILGVETSRNMGDIQSKFREYQQNIALEEQKTGRFFADQLLTLNQKKIDAMDELKKEFNNKIFQIRNSRAELQGAKASKQMELLAESASRARALNAQFQEYQNALTTWKQVRDETIASAKNYAWTKYEIPSVGDIGGINVSTGGSGGGSSPTGTMYNYPSDEEVAAYSAKGYVPAQSTSGKWYWKLKNEDTSDGNW